MSKTILGELDGYTPVPNALVLKFGTSTALVWIRGRKNSNETILLCANCHGEVHAGIRVLSEQQGAQLTAESRGVS